MPTLSPSTARGLRARDVVILLLATAAAATAADKAITPVQLEFFEKRVRPLLVGRCFKCHSGKSKVLEGGLRLDSRKGVLTGGDSGAAVVPGDPDKSLMVRSIRYQAFEMPPTGKLKPAEISVLVEWVRQGAFWPAQATPTVARTPEGNYDFKKIRATHWAYRPLGKPKPPVVKRSEWPRKTLDRFVLARLEAAGFEAADAADRRTLIRRVTLDLIGLPPTPEQVAAFLEDDRVDAWARLIDRLLESPHYGERWGRHWLDVARYSDGFGGYLDNTALPHSWRYRDWVVRSFNSDLPYNEFVRQQVAGDLMPETPGAWAGSGFFAIGPTYRSDGGDPDSKAQARSETLDDRVDVLSRGFLGLTVSCARCHAHKFDPIPHQDYYSLAGVFNNTKMVIRSQATPAQQKAYNLHHAAIKRLDGEVKQLAAATGKAGKQATATQKQDLAAKQAQLKSLRETAPAAFPQLHVLGDTGSADMPLALRGNLRKPGPIAPRRFLRLLSGANARKFTRGSGRLDLADALVDPSNPLTPKVMVNRVWAWHFGAGLVRSPSNFGSQGEKPTHPELLEWLAADFVEHGWSIKRLHRTILLSATYRQASTFHKKNFARDGDNRLLWRFTPRRLDVEAWRDSLLSVTGELKLDLGGASTEDVRGSRRRTMYYKISRTGDRFATDIFLRLFDFPIPRASIAKRPQSTVPQQYLFMLNSPMMIDRARSLVARLKSDARDESKRIDRAYHLLYGRSPTPLEAQLAVDFLETPRTAVAKAKPEKRDDILVSNFESGNYGKWTKTGQAFGPKPAPGTLPNQMNVSGFRGKGLVNTFFNHDKTVGTLTSPGFTINRKRIAFLIGGGRHPGKTCIQLLVADTVVRSTTGQNNELLQWSSWDVAEWAGKSVRIRIVDQVTGGWGHINIDHIVQTDQQQPAAPREPPLDRWTQYAQVLLGSNEFMFVR
jgi:hypothetical protein